MNQIIKIKEIRKAIKRDGSPVWEKADPKTGLMQYLAEIVDEQDNAYSMFSNKIPTFAEVGAEVNVEYEVNEYGTKKATKVSLISVEDPTKSLSEGLTDSPVQGDPVLQELIKINEKLDVIVRNTGTQGF